MPRFRLLAGQYIQREPSHRDDDGNMVFAHKKYIMGQTFENDSDLAERFGTDKFERLPGGSPVRRTPSSHPGMASPAQEVGVAPGGQVSQGFQHTTSTPDGRQISGALPQDIVDELVERGVLVPQGERFTVAANTKQSTDDERERRNTANERRLKEIEARAKAREQMTEHGGLRSVRDEMETDAEDERGMQRKQRERDQQELKGTHRPGPVRQPRQSTSESSTRATQTVHTERGESKASDSGTDAERTPETQQREVSQPKDAASHSRQGGVEPSTPAGSTPVRTDPATHHTATSTGETPVAPKLGEKAEQETTHTPATPPKDDTSDRAGRRGKR